MKSPATGNSFASFQKQFLLVLLAFSVFLLPVLSGPTISGLPPDDVEEKAAAETPQHQRHAFRMLEPELAASIFAREGVAKNPLKRTTTMPLTDRLDSGNTGPRNTNEKQTKRQPRSVAPSEYESLNEDFISEYDALNLDFSLDDGAKEAKPIEVPAQDLLGQDTQKLPEFPPKEWWDDEEELAEGTTTKMPNKEKRPVLKASKLLAANERPKERRRELPLVVEEDRIDLPPKNGGKKTRRTRAAPRVEGMARLDGVTVGRPFSVDRDQLKVLPRLVPSYPAPTTTTPVTIGTTTVELQERRQNGTHGQKKGGTVGQQNRSQKKQQQQQKQQQEFFRDLPSGIDEPTGLVDGKPAMAKLSIPQKQQLLPSAQFFPEQQPIQEPPLQTQAQFQFKPAESRPFPAEQQQPFQPVLNLGSSDAATEQSKNEQQQPGIGQPQVNSPQNHGQSSPAGRLLPTGFVHIATLERPPQLVGANQIVIGGQRFWIEKTVPLSQFYKNDAQQPNGQGVPQPKSQPAEELPALLEMPQLEQQPPNNSPNNENTPPTFEFSPNAPEAASEQQQQGLPELLPTIRQNQPRRAPANTARVANSARVFSLADQQVPLWTGEQHLQQQHSTSAGRKFKRVSSNNKQNSLLALNLGAALSQIFGNFTIEHDAKLVERKPDPALDFAGPPHAHAPVDEASSEPHRITRFFERPERHLHGN